MIVMIGQARFRWFFLGALSLYGLGLGLAPAASAARNPLDWAFIGLDYIRQEKSDGLARLMGRLRGLAREAAVDEYLVAFFDISRQYLEARNEFPESLAANVSTLRSQVDAYALERYYAFQDIMFLTLEGRLAHSIRKRTSTGEAPAQVVDPDSPLGNCLARKPTTGVFVDFHRREPTAEVAAFFVEPISRNGRLLGWLALRCAGAKINSLFSGTEGAWSTGETFLVNRQGLMLTDSYFCSESTVLEKHLDDKNIKAKFKQGSGGIEVTDYRGVRALTSFEVFEFMGTRWLVVAKVDRDEIVTREYQAHGHYYIDELQKIVTSRRSKEAVAQGACGNDRAVLRVEMDEFLKATSGELLQTTGISTCTGFGAFVPGRFGYLGHITPLDRTCGGEATDLLSQITKRMQSFDLYPCEKHAVVLVVVAPHTRCLGNIVDRLLLQGFLLSQINVLCEAGAKAGVMSLDYVAPEVLVTWKTDEGQIRHQGLDHGVNLGRAMESIL
ncbi:MAG: hypothetical protein EOM25_00520 [Deltaproteobacteria bacterium]|nr:hypothetical protein [Deltaproteobacteria bacterium]